MNEKEKEKEKEKETENDETETTLYVKYMEPDEALEQPLDGIRSLKQGDEPEDTPMVVVTTKEDLNIVTRDTTIDLINVIAEHEPASIRETARLVDRSPIDVKKNLDELERIGMIRFEKDGNAKRPIVWYDKLDLEVPVPA
ncbi:MAG: transcriptional regulator [Halobacteria archaeon]|nr:transcriptional regulator [Halobacteria archaeon]